MTRQIGSWTFNAHDVDRVFAIAASLVKPGTSMVTAHIHQAAQRYVDIMAELPGEEASASSGPSSYVIIPGHPAAFHAAWSAIPSSRTCRA